MRLTPYMNSADLTAARDKSSQNNALDSAVGAFADVAHSSNPSSQAYATRKMQALAEERGGEIKIETPYNHTTYDNKTVNIPPGTYSAEQLTTIMGEQMHLKPEVVQALATTQRTLAQAEAQLGPKPNDAPALQSALGVPVRDVPSSGRDDHISAIDIPKMTPEQSSKFIETVLEPARDKLKIPPDQLSFSEGGDIRGTNDKQVLVQASRDAMATLVAHQKELQPQIQKFMAEEGLSGHGAAHGQHQERQQAAPSPAPAGTGTRLDPEQQAAVNTAARREAAATAQFGAQHESGHTKGPADSAAHLADSQANRPKEGTQQAPAPSPQAQPSSLFTAQAPAFESSTAPAGPRDPVTSYKGQSYAGSEIPREVVRSGQAMLEQIGISTGGKNHAHGKDAKPEQMDGIVGPNTDKAVRAFQEQHGMKVTGKFDDQTLDALKQAVENPGKDFKVEPEKPLGITGAPADKPIKVDLSKIDFGPMPDLKALGVSGGEHHDANHKPAAQAVMAENHVASGKGGIGG